MNKSRLAFVLDIAFRYIIIFFVAFAWLRFYIYNGVVCALIAFAISVAINTTISAVTNHRNSLKKNNAQEQSKIDECAFKLASMEVGLRAKFFATLFPDAVNKRAYKNYLSFKLNHKKMKMIYCESASQEKVLEILSNYQKDCDKIILVATEWKSDVRALASNLNYDIVLLDREQMYHLLYAKTNSYPQSKIAYKFKPKVKLVDILELCLQKKNWFRYFWAGLLILFVSMVVPFRNYYIVWGSLLLGLSFLCLIRPLWRKSISKNWLD